MKKTSLRKIIAGGIAISFVCFQVLPPVVFAATTPVGGTSAAVPEKAYDPNAVTPAVVAKDVPSGAAITPEPPLTPAVQVVQGSK